MSLLSIIDFWFKGNPRKTKWFVKNPSIIDDTIIIKYKKLLLELEKTSKKDIIQKTNIEIVVSIICLDQFSRHVYRGNPTNSGIIYKNTKKALYLTNYLYFSEKIYSVHEDHLAFVLMPYKHCGVSICFQYIHNVISKTININIKSESILFRFYADSLKKFISNCIPVPMVRNPHYKYCSMDLSCVCDFYPKKTHFHDIQISKEHLYKTLMNFITKLDMEHSKNIVISLSGGPDSMVIAFILSKIMEQNPEYNFSAFHLNYNNRDESSIEMEVVTRFCFDIGLKLLTHDIEYLKRRNSKRKFYEKKTREIRFSCYRKLGGNIILGHIKEDLIENIWTNFARGRDLFKLHKIDPISKQNDITIFRPFNMVEKSDIYDFAHRYNIPYLKNTTPVTSNRGKCRTNFLPAVKKQFGSKTNDKILYMSNALVSYKKLLDKKIFNPIFESVTKMKNYGLSLNITDYLEMDIHFWKHVLTELYHIIGFSMPRIHSIKNFVFMMNRGHKGMVEIKNNTLTFIEDDGYLYILDKSKISEILGKEPNKIVKGDWKMIKKFLL